MSVAGVSTSAVVSSGVFNNSVSSASTASSAQVAAAGGNAVGATDPKHDERRLAAVRLDLLRTKTLEAVFGKPSNDDGDVGAALANATGATTCARA